MVQKTRLCMCACVCKRVFEIICTVRMYTFLTNAIRALTVLRFRFVRLYKYQMPLVASKRLRIRRNMGEKGVRAQHNKTYWRVQRPNCAQRQNYRAGICGTFMLMILTMLGWENCDSAGSTESRCFRRVRVLQLGGTN